MADIKTWKSDFLVVTIKIDYDKFASAGDCVSVCHASPKVYEFVHNKSTAPNIDECIQYCACEYNCPTGAISHSFCWKVGKKVMIKASLSS